MRAVVQRVSEARVRVDGEIVGEIGTGLLVLVGVTHDDTMSTAAALARKIHGLRILDGERSIADGAADPDSDPTADPAADPGAGNLPADAPAVLAVSQFTLYGDARKGRRPTWAAAAPGPVAQPLFDAVVAELRAAGTRVETGVFGADMRVELVNDGPMTLILELEAGLRHRAGNTAHH